MPPVGRGPAAATAAADESHDDVIAATERGIQRIRHTYHLAWVWLHLRDCLTWETSGLAVGRHAAAAPDAGREDRLVAHQPPAGTVLATAVGSPAGGAGLVVRNFALIPRSSIQASALWWSSELHRAGRGPVMRPSRTRADSSRRLWWPPYEASSPSALHPGGRVAMRPARSLTSQVNWSLSWSHTHLGRRAGR